MKKIVFPLVTLLLLIVFILHNNLAHTASKPLPPTPFTALPGDLKSTVFIFYYSWYSAPPRTKNYGHWDGGGAYSNLPSDIMSAFYPKNGLYDSADPEVVNTQMQQIKNSGADVVVVSWWGKGTEDDSHAKIILDKASANGLKVSFIIEPYSGRTTSSIISDISYLNSKYGSNPAFYKVSRPTLYAPSTKQRGVYFLYELNTTSNLSKYFDSIRNTPNDSILVARMDDSKLYSDSDVRKIIDYTHLDGLFNYSETSLSATFPRSKDYILIFGVQPGQDHTRIPPFTDKLSQSRENGAYYDRYWKKVVEQKPEAVSIISFNEWGESTQIEPAKPFSSGDYTYNNYEGSYGKSGSQASDAYLERTRYWVDIYKR